jgi:uncharacterized Zn finger protein
MEEIEFECPKCDDGALHKAVVMKKREKGEKLVMEIQCKDCGSKGVVYKIKSIGIEVFDFP